MSGPGVPVTVIGVGNPFRRDDAAGLVVAAALRQRFAADERVVTLELDGEPVRLIQAWDGSDHVIVVDALRSGAAAGTIHRFDVTDVDTSPTGATGTTASGHALGIGDAVELAAALGCLPPTLEVIAIEGASFELGEGLSPPVADACDAAVEELTARIGAVLGSG